MYVDVHITSISFYMYMYVVMSLVWTRLKEQSSVTLGLIVDHLIQSKATLLPCELQEQSSNISYLEISLKF